MASSDAATPGGGGSPAPRLLRDPWAWIVLLAVIPLVAHMWGAPLGVPVADDFDYLHRVSLSGQHTLLDGCGSIFYWRPLSRQVYFEVLWRLILMAPAMVAWFHVVLLALTSLVLYRAFRAGWSGPLAAAVATFPLFAESTRMLVTWPSNFQDLGAMFFAAVALHEAARRRLATTMLALLASLLSKEVGVLAALLIPWMPQRGGAEPRERLRWAAWTASLVVVWGSAYVAVSRFAGLSVPSQLETDPAALAAPLQAKITWALWNSARSAFSLPAIDVPGESLIWIPVLLLLGAAMVLVTVNANARSRLQAMRGWPLWGLAWFLVSASTLLAIFPTWAAYRGIFATIGIGITLVALLGAASPWLVAGLTAVRLLAFAASPGPPAGVAGTALMTGAAIDFPNLVRIQRLVGEARDLLQSEFPSLPQGAAVVQHHLPHMSEWAFVGDKALQTWYADTTLRWVRFDAFRADTTISAATIVEYQPDRALQLALVEPDAMRLLLGAEAPIRSADWVEVLNRLKRAEALQRDQGAVVFLGTVVAKQALALAGLDRNDEAILEAQRALDLWRDNQDSRYVLAYVLHREGRLAEAEAQLDTMLQVYPGDGGAHALREQIRAARNR